MHKGIYPHIVIGLLLYVVAALIRLHGISELPPQADESLWVRRSTKVLAVYRQNPLESTTHLGHPGVPPALVMTAAQWLREKAIDHWQLKPGDRFYLNRLDACRIAIALVSAFVVAVVYWGGALLFCSSAGLMAAILVALDPRHIANSQIAHLDATLTLLVTLSVLLYLLAVQHRRLSLKLASGVAWGLGIATKRTAGLLIPGFFLYRILRNILVPSSRRGGEKKVLGWGDFAAVLIGHLSLALIYTRLWSHRSEYRVRLDIRTPVARHLWRNGLYLQRNPEILALILAGICLVIGLIYWNYVWKKRAWKLHLCRLLGFGGLLTLFLAIFPQVFENFARYWKWASSLSGEQHLSFGHLKPPPPQGYFDLALSELPELVLLGIIFASIVFFVRVFRDGCSDRLFTLPALFLIALVWIIPLNISDKQTWRYALPIVPGLYLMAGVGWVELKTFLWRWLKKRERTLSPLFKRIGFAALRGFLPFILLLQTVDTLSWAPNYRVYFNRLKGGLAGALEREQGFEFIGQRELVDFFMARTRSDDQQRYITVFGGANTLKHTAYRMYGKEARERLSFGFFTRQGSDYLVEFLSHHNMRVERGWDDILELPPLFSYRLRGVDLVHVYEMPYHPLEDGLVIRAGDTHRHAGHVVRSADKKTKYVTALPGRNKPGALLFTEGVRVRAGVYELTVPASFYGSVEEDDAHEDDIAFIIQLSSHCQRSIKRGELASEINQFQLRCSFDTPLRLVPVTTWEGKVGVKVGNHLLRKVE